MIGSMIPVLVLLTVFSVSDAQVDTSTCGTSKSCLLSPENCAGNACEYIITWVMSGSTFNFEMDVRTDGWAAIGFSTDNMMGDDSVIECSIDPSNSNTVRVLNSYNPGRFNQALTPDNMGISNAMGTFANGRITCSFTRSVTVSQTNVFDLDRSYFLLIGRGTVSASGTKNIHGLGDNLPIRSATEINLATIMSIGGSAGPNKVPFVKAHGSLMILAWAAFASVGIIMARYFKPIWPNSKLCGEKVWFAIHRSCMVSVLILTVTAFILIFSGVQEWTMLSITPAAPGERFYPDAVKGHPFLGVIVTFLCILNPIMAIFRPHPGTPNRPIFNWAHWAVGTLAHVTAILTIFFGLNMPNAPYIGQHLTWVMIAFVVFHVLMQILFEIIGCVSMKRNKELKESFEMAKSNGRIDSGEPEPTPEGSSLKILLLVLHVLGVFGFAIALVILIAIS